MIRLVLCLALIPAAAALPAARAGEAQDGPLTLVEEGKVYRKVNGEPITGRDVLDLVIESNWDKYLQAFVEYTVCEEELRERHESANDGEVEAELQALIDHYAKAMGVNPTEVKIEKLVREAGLPGGMAALRRQTRINLGMLRLLQKEKAVPAQARTWDRNFRTLLGERIEKLLARKGVERDPAKLGTGEAVRIGSRSCSRGEVRTYMADMLREMPMKELRERMEVLTFERVISGALKEAGVTLTEEDLTFHFSYLCRKKEAEVGVNGRLLVARDIKSLGLTPEQFLHDRRTKADAGITRLAKAPIGGTQLREEFAAHPERYSRTEKLVAHILVRVLDPDGRAYTPQWQAAGHDAVNEYAARVREERFAAAKPKIEALVAPAKADFAATAVKHSDDATTRMVGGAIGRVGKETVLVGNLDNTVRDEALKLKPGDMAGPIRSDFGWHLVKCLEKQDVTYEEAEERVYMQLIHEGRVKLTAKLTQNAKIEEKAE
jgi:parvulin-like peptidyl-prolyl isomerase